MKSSRILALAIFAAASMPTLAASEAPKAESAAASAAMPQDCAKMMKTSHGHATPTKATSSKGSMMDCGNAASAPQGKKKKTDFGHLHGR